VWQRAMELATLCYRSTSSFPKSEMFGMTSQIRRSAASVPANIAEGNGRETTGVYIHFLRIAQGSLKELEAHVLLSRNVDLMKQETADEILNLADEVGRLLRALIRSLQARLETQ
jgi:four helix bundle protein